MLDLSYILENTNLLITSELVKGVIKETYIFNNIILMFKPCIVKTLFKSNLCYDLDLVLNKRHTLVLSNTRELDRVPSTNIYLIYKLLMVHAPLS